MQRKILLVTGSSGLIGSEVANRFDDFGTDAAGTLNLLEPARRASQPANSGGAS